MPLSLREPRGMVIGTYPVSIAAAAPCLCEDVGTPAADAARERATSSQDLPPVPPWRFHIELGSLQGKHMPEGSLSSLVAIRGVYNRTLRGYYLRPGGKPMTCTYTRLAAYLWRRVRASGKRKRCPTAIAGDWMDWSRCNAEFVCL